MVVVGQNDLALGMWSPFLDCRPFPPACWWTPNWGRDLVSYLACISNHPSRVSIYPFQSNMVLCPPGGSSYLLLGHCPILPHAHTSLPDLVLLVEQFSSLLSECWEMLIIFSNLSSFFDYESILGKMWSMSWSATAKKWYFPDFLLNTSTVLSPC